MKKRIVIVLEFTEGRQHPEDEPPRIEVEDTAHGVRIARVGKNGGEEQVFMWPDTRIKYTNRS